ncbi:FkbM family methyltransferase [Paenibacillus sp. OSY-SE]|uniref:FkbM family methyltransferase n=1 Tax=Paenibacillus sp. OSY-SE TaxID=1196323 RepID=UPI0002F9D7A4|nr:FkbM family methyltransferase [Paenibacillus sp. OSY-SE]
MHAIYMGNERLLVKPVYGGKLIVPSADLSITPELVMHGAMEWPLMKYLENHVKKGHVLVDIGANVGYFTVFLAHLTGPSGQVYAYEPHPLLFSFLQDNVALNYLHDRVRLYPQAVSSSSAPLQFQASQRYMGNSSVNKHSQQYFKHYRDDISEFETEAIRLDDALAHLPHIDMIKVDIEGGEYQAFLGMEQLLEHNVKCVVFE